MTDAGSRIVREIEAAWKAIQANCPDVPDVVVCTGTGQGPKGSAKWAHFWANRWVTDPKTSERKPELFVAGELLGETGRRIMQTLLHEAAHGVNYTRGEQGTNVNGRHNKTFVKAAVELGLIWPEGQKPHGTHGFSQVEITDETAEKYADTIAALEKAHLAYLTWITATTKTGTETGEGGEGGETPTGGRGSRGGTRGGKRIIVVCECEDADPFPITPARLARKVILCGDCREPYRPQDEEASAA